LRKAEPVAGKIACSVPEHRGVADCLEQLDALRDPSDAPPEALAREVPCLFARLKQRIVRLRRETHDDWPWFRQEVVEHLEPIARLCNTRWLLSIVDTFADHGTPQERGNAMAVALLPTWEKLALTLRLAQGGLEASDRGVAAVDLATPQPLWDGMTSMIDTAGANVVPNLFRRLHSVVAGTPALQRILISILERMRRHPQSTLSCLDRRHERDLWADVEAGAAADSHAAPPRAPLAHAPARDAEGDLVREYRRATLESLHAISDGLATVIANQQALHAGLAGRFETQAAEDERRDWIGELRYRDLLQLLDRAQPIAPPCAVVLKTDHPLAADSPDHRFPHGTAKDNTRAPWFVRRCEERLARRAARLRVLDLGCAGGGLVFDFTLRGHLAIGLEGSDLSRRRARAEWRLLEDRLFTCDVAERFDLADSEGDPVTFDLITAWDVLEHLDEARLGTFFDNVRRHLAPDGWFLASVSTRPSAASPDGRPYHATVRDRAWWERTLADCGLAPVADSPFRPEDFPRGNGVSPLFPANFSQTPESGFFAVARRSERALARIADNGESAYVHLENICDRARLDVEKVKHFLRANGYRLTDDRGRADHVLLFGCAFNNYTEEQSKKRLDEFVAGKRAGQRVYAIEGIADTLGRELARDGVVDADKVIPTGRYGRLDAHFARVQTFDETPESNLVGWLTTTTQDRPLGSLPVVGQGGPLKFSVQIGHGCMDRCAFCGDKVVVKNLRSKPLDDVLREVQRGLSLGYRYIELIGDDVGAYGLDLGADLVALLDRITLLPGEFELNLKELNTKYLVRYGDRLDAPLSRGRLRNLVVAFQSGNDRILDLMKRGYDRAGLGRAMSQLSRHGIAKHGHAIIGFPTETDAEFDETLAVVAANGFESCSFFLYQDRRTAPAHKIEPKVAEADMLARLARAERLFTARGYEVRRRPDKLQVFQRPAAVECGVAARAATRTVS
jgi:tRNA A37 methylthiotransferase MiaB/SAM-dependent methyltransferase